MARVFRAHIDEHRLARPRPVLDLFEFAPGVLPFDLYLQKQNRLQRAADVAAAGACPADLNGSFSPSAQNQIGTRPEGPAPSSTDTNVMCDIARRYGAARLGDLNPAPPQTEPMSAARPVVTQYIKVLTFPSGLIIDVVA